MGKHAIIATGISKIKTMKKLNRKSGLVQRFKTAPVLMSIALLIVGSGTSMAIVHAESIQQQINDLNAQNSQTQNAVDSLQLQAKSYQDAISKLQVQISDIRNAIAASKAKQAQLQAQIVADQQKLAQEKQILGEDLKAMYVGGKMTTVEMLATSKNLSDFVDAETYDSAVQNKIQDTLNQITALQARLEAQKTQVDQLLATQQAQQGKLDSDEAQQNQLLSMNQGQQAAYNNQIKANQSKISQLVAEQAAINAQYAQNVRVAPSGGGGACNLGQGFADYPWCNAPFTFDYSPTDPNGFPERQCTSFAYWYFTSVEGKALSVSGDAGDWWSTANRPVDHTPQVGAIGIEPRNQPPHYSPYGHVMIVLALPGTTYNGALPYTSQADGIYVDPGNVLVMSMNEDEAGHFMIQEWPADTLYYIH